MPKLSIHQRPVSNPQADIFKQTHPLLAQLYASRGVEDIDQLGTELKQLLPDNLLLDIDTAAQRLATAVQQQESVLIIGDFDCDGATSTTLAMLALRRMGLTKVDYLVPSRFAEGYGLSEALLEKAAPLQPDLLLTVDNGISSVAGVEAANALGIDVIITDHHLPGLELPKAVAIVNPNQPNCTFAAKSTAGVGVIFYLMIALRRELQQQNWFAQNNLEQPNLAELLDLVALGTVADVVALEKNNRILVQQGVQRIRAGKTRPGILALLSLVNKNPAQLAASDLGFSIAPRLNAAGRLEDISTGIECLLADDMAQALELAERLDQLNQQRRAIEAEMQEQATEMLEQLPALDSKLGICLYDSAWHQGVIGILAGRIKERYQRPVIVFAEAEQGEIKGSARSISSLHIRDVLADIDRQQPQLINKFGGHAMAAGLSLSKKHYPAFVKAFNTVLTEHLDADTMQQKIYTDGVLASNYLNLETADLLRQSNVWGQGFPEPIFQGQFRLIEQKLLKQKYLKLLVSDSQTGTAIEAICFNVDAAIWPNDTLDKVELVYRLTINEFRGSRTVQLLVDEILPL